MGLRNTIRGKKDLFDVKKETDIYMIYARIIREVEEQ